METGRLLGEFTIRPPRLADATALAAAYERNRTHLAPYEPRRTQDFFTAKAQRETLADSLDARAHGRSAGWLIFHGDRVVGRINLNNIVRGVMQGADLGYWTDVETTGRGLATAGVTFACQAARGLGLHRVQASTLEHNHASKQVLRKCGFDPVGHAPTYLFIDGAWRDHDLFQRILHRNPLR